MEVGDKKRISCISLAKKIQGCPVLKKLFGSKKSETFEQFKTSRLDRPEK